MRSRFRIGLRNGVLTMRVDWGANLLIGVCFIAISAFTAAQAPAQTSSSPLQTKANETKAEKESVSGACDTKANDLASRIQESAAQNAGEYPDKMSEGNGKGASATNLTLKTQSTTESTTKEVEGGEPAMEVRQASRSEESARPNTNSPQQCTVSKGSRETEHVPLR
jgi:hypothetical protein